MTNKTRVANDYYPSPEKLISAWWEEFGQFALSEDSAILEPCNGGGVIANHLRKQGLKVLSTDLQDGKQYDATTADYWNTLSTYGVDYTITNPPFNQAVPIIDHALANSRKGVIMILRASFMEPCKDRRHLLNERIASIIYVNPRPRFRADTKQTDSSTVVFIHWDNNKDPETETKINYLTDWNK